MKFVETDRILSITPADGGGTVVTVTIPDGMEDSIRAEQLSDGREL